MPQVKGQSAKSPNVIQARILAICSALTMWPSPPVNQTRLEELVGLTGGSLKDAVRRRSFSKAVAAALVEKLPALGVAGVTLDWLHQGRGEGPRKGGVLPPSGPQDERSARGSAPSGGAPRSARSALTGHNTPVAVSTGGEEDVSGSPGTHADEAVMAATAFQRAVQTALSDDEFTHTRRGREAVYEELRAFAERLRELDLGNAAFDVMAAAAKIREGP